MIGVLLKEADADVGPGGSARLVGTNLEGGGILIHILYIKLFY